MFRSAWTFEARLQHASFAASHTSPGRPPQDQKPGPSCSDRAMLTAVLTDDNIIAAIVLIKAVSCMVEVIHHIQAAQRRTAETCWMPALLTSMSTPPNSSAALAIMSLHG